MFHLKVRKPRGRTLAINIAAGLALLLLMAAVFSVGKYCGKLHQDTGNGAPAHQTIPKDLP